MSETQFSAAAVRIAEAYWAAHPLQLDTHVTDIMAFQRLLDDGIIYPGTGVDKQPDLTANLVHVPSTEIFAAEKIDSVLFGDPDASPYPAMELVNRRELQWLEHAADTSPPEIVGQLELEADDE
ncbi:MAG: hypothetical protein DWQ20_07000 [Actinobacteria bacterium]|nr:MAG: hypothetical protein DWQ20_07000 [Actinomycetota bacterium]